MISSLMHGLEVELHTRGFAHVPGPIDVDAYRRLAVALGRIVGEESIALRPGAHAYVAKPGPVPLHTDHPEVDLVAWRCEEQDDVDGASLLFDARALVEGLSEGQRELLRQVELVCPPLSGGPPTLRFPVLRPDRTGDAIFCSPWLKSANAIPEHEDGLEYFRGRLSAEAKRSSVNVLLALGDALFVDNHRVLHGRRAIADASRRRRHRLWIGGAGRGSFGGVRP